MITGMLASLLSRPHGGGGGDGLLGALLGGAVLIIVLVVALFVWLVFGYLLSRIFVKANKPAIAAFIPFWNLIVILEMVGKPGWWVLLYLIPFVGLCVHIYVQALLLERFGVEQPMSYILAVAGIFIGVIPLVLLVWGAFGDVTYRAPSAFAGASPAY